MASVGKLYVDGIYARFSYLATWLPNSNLKLGDVGVHQGAEFKQMTTLKDLAIPFRVRKGVNSVDFSCTSESGVTVKTKVAGEAIAGTALPLGSVGMSIQFSRQGAFLFHAAQCIADEIDDKAALGQAVISLVKSGRWEPGWAVIDTVVRAGTATIVVSNSGSAGLDLTVKTPEALANLANLEGGFSVASQSGDILQFIAAKGLAPLFRLSRVKQSLVSRLLGRTSAITFGGPTLDEDPVVSDEEPFESVAPR